MTASPRSWVNPAAGPLNSLTDVAGLLAGHEQALDPGATLGTGAATGVTVVRAPGGAIAAVDVRGAAPGTRETDLLDPSNTVQHAHAIVLAGGSAYGLAAADGVMRWLEEHGEGIPMDETAGHVVPIVSAAVIFDLPVGDWVIRPDAQSGYRAAAAAGHEFARGCVGAGTGARAGSLKGGIGTASVIVPDGPAAGVTVGALMVVNAAGQAFDPATGLPWGAGSDGPGFFGLTRATPAQLAAANALGAKGEQLNTTIGVVATDAALPAVACKRMAMAAHDGLARAIRPAHTPVDGDAIFALATGRFAGEIPALPLPQAFPAELPLTAAVCQAAALAVERAIVDALLAAHAVAGIPAYTDVFGSQ